MGMGRNQREGVREEVKQVPKLKHRDSRFELLRIAAMLMIVLGHFATQSGIFSELRGASYHAFYYFISLGPRIGVDLFVMIGAWFLSDSDFRARRLLDLYLRLFLYCVPITILGKLFLPDVGAEALVRGILPFSGSPLWFVSCYIMLLMAGPLLNYALSFRLLTERLILTGLVLICLIPTFTLRNDYFFLGEEIWFMLLYLLTGYLKRSLRGDYPGERTWEGRFLSRLIIRRAGIAYLLSAACYLSLFFFGLFVSDVLLPAFPALSAGLKDGLNLAFYFVNMNMLPAFLCALFLFEGVLGSRVRYSRFINFLGRKTFTVYILHQIPALLPSIWLLLFRTGSWGASPFSPFFTALIPAALFAAAIVLDFVYAEPLLSVLARSGFYRRAERWMQSFFGKPDERSAL